MHKQLAQTVSADDAGNWYIENDWYEHPLPSNIFLDEMTYPDTAYSFKSFFSQKEQAFSLGYASGNYGHSIFTTGLNGKISIGKFVVLQCTHIISNHSVTIGDHCMFSWGSVITDSWIGNNGPGIRRSILQKLARSVHRHPEFTDPRPVVIGDNVWVGFGAVILPGVHVGRGAVIGCKSIITEDVPAYAVVAGDPARIIKYLDPTDTDEARASAMNYYLNLQHDEFKS